MSQYHPAAHIIQRREKIYKQSSLHFSLRFTSLHQPEEDMFRCKKKVSVEVRRIDSKAERELSTVCRTVSSTALLLLRAWPVSSPESRMLLSDLDTVQRVTQKKLSVRTSLKQMDFCLVLLCSWVSLLIFENHASIASIVFLFSGQGVIFPPPVSSRDGFPAFLAFSQVN